MFLKKLLRKPSIFGKVWDLLDLKGPVEEARIPGSLLSGRGFFDPRMFQSRDWAGFFLILCGFTGCQAVGRAA